MSKEIEEKVFLETYKNRNTYRVIETFTPPNRNKNWAKKGDVYGSDVIFDWGLNPETLVKEGKIVLLEKEPFQWQKDIVGKNKHSVYNWCPECLKFDINMPLENECSDCGHSATITYYDAKTINDYINHLTLQPREEDEGYLFYCVDCQSGFNENEICPNCNKPKEDEEK